MPARIHPSRVAVSFSLLSLSLLMVLGACSSNQVLVPPVASPSPVSSVSASPRPASSADLPEIKDLESTWAAEWMDLTRSLVQKTGTNPPAAARAFAYAGVGLYESLASVNKDLPSFQGKLAGLKDLPKPPAGQTLDARWVAQGALSTLVPTLFYVALSDEQKELISTLEAQFNVQFKVTAAVKEASVAYGTQLGRALSSWSFQDGFNELAGKAYALPSRTGHPEFWEPTVKNAKPLEPFWGDLRTFVLPNGSACHTTPSVAFSTASDSAFYAQAKEVQDTVSQLSEDQTTIARWWADNPGQTSTPPGHWLAIAGQLVRERKLSPADSARVYALLGVSLADAFISCWKTKYQVNLVRPMTYIRENLGQSNWIPLLATPMFPEYPSGHSAGSGAAAQVLTRLLGDTAFVDKTHITRGMEARSFSNFHTAAQEAAISRLYGGIHYRDAIDGGLKQGQCVGDQALARLMPTN